MKERDVLRRIDALRAAVLQGRRDVALIGMTREQRAAFEQHLDHILARLDQARETLAKLCEQAS